MNTPDVLLNHFYLVLDNDTYRDIENSEFLRQHFAPAEVRSTQRTDISYTGLYFYGHSTYFEFFSETGGIDHTPGQSAIAFGFEQVGHTQRMAALGTEPPFVVTRPYAEAQVPWFWFLRLPHSDFLKLWTMEYLPTFLQEWNPADTPANSLSRAQVLERYKGLITPLENPLFEDITSIELNLADEQGLRSLLAQLGYQISTLGPHAWAATAPDGHQICHQPSEGPQGIRRVTFRLRPFAEPQEWRFGSRSVLQLSGERAVWTF